MRRIALPLLLLLAACAREAPVPEAAAVSFRDRSVPIASTVRGSVEDLAGDWVIAQSYPGLPFAAPGTRVTVAAAGNASLWRFAGPGGAREVAARTEVPGRYRPLAEGDPELWLLWVDDDFRTAVIGTPDGSFGWIMDRPGAASADRTRAAREVLDFNGYDLGRLGA